MKTTAIASASCQAIVLEAGPKSRPAWSMSALRDVLAIWEERLRYRRSLEQMSTDNPHLIDDIGLSGEMVETEIAKRFWQN